QAADGIRDFHVTGVQTCALPIYRTGTCLQRLAERHRAVMLLEKVAESLVRQLLDARKPISREPFERAPRLTIEFDDLANRTCGQTGRASWRARRVRRSDGDACPQ